MTEQLHSAAQRFFGQLEAENTRAFWQTNRSIYDQQLRPGFEAIIAGIDGFAEWRIYRPTNDTRFHPEKEPYKTFLGAVAERTDGVGAFVQLSRRGWLIGTGMPMPAPDQLQRLRSAIADANTGLVFVEAIAQARATGATVHGGRWDALKRVPKPYDPQHPRRDYLCWKGIEINYRPDPLDWIDAASAARTITAILHTPEPLHHWLATHVGASSLTAEERFAPRRKGST